MKELIENYRARLVALLRDEDTTWAQELERRQQDELNRLFIEEQQRVVTERLAALFDEEERASWLN